MKFATFSLVIGVLAFLARPAEAERLDCSLFRGAQSQFACYDNLSRAPKPDSEATAQPAAAKSSLGRTRRTGAHGITPAERRSP